MEFVRTFFQDMSNVVAVLAFLSPAAAAGFGKLPRAGPGRAIVLGCSTRFWPFRPSIVTSQRADLVNEVKGHLTQLENDQYIVVFGQKGVGKSTVVDNALDGASGVMFIDVAPAASHKEIVADVMREVTRNTATFVNVYPGAARVIKWHRRIFRVKPTVVLRVRERGPNKDAADVGSAVRVLVEHGLRVVIDSSDNSLQALAAVSLRQLLVPVQPMERAVLEKIPELAGLLAAIDASGDAEVVWVVLGGVPASYRLLMSAWQKAGSPPDGPAVTAVVDRYLKQQLKDANVELNRATTGKPDLDTFYQLFNKVDKLLQSEMKTSGITLASPDKVLCMINREDADEALVVPATAAMAQVLRHGKDGKPPTVQQLRAGLVKAVPKKGGEELK